MIKQWNWLRNRNFKQHAVQVLSIDSKGSGQFTNRGYFDKQYIKSFEKLPGKPLDSDDLMLSLSGDKIFVECHVDGCGMAGGITELLYWDSIDMGDGKKVAVFKHNASDKCLAKFIGGCIVFEDGVEGGVFVKEDLLK